MTLSLSLQNKAGINICINISVYIGLYTRQNSFTMIYYRTADIARI